MSPEFAQFAPLFLVSPFLAAMALWDLKNLRISNRLILAMLAVFVMAAPFFLSLDELGYRAMACAAAFVLGVFGFALRLWGGGDVKAIAVLLLFVPSQSLLLYAYSFSASMALGMILVVTSRSVLGHAGSSWSALRPQAGYPMGVSIALSGLLLFLATIALSL